ncbi:MAG: Flp pilus assembly protein CpaB [Candidatus Dormibacteria bacterium]
MSIQASKPNNRVFLMLGILLAALAFGGVLFALRQNSAGGSTQSVVVAKKPLPVGTTITADVVTTQDVPTNAVPSDAYTVPSAVLSKTTTAAVGANAPLVPAYFASSPLAAPQAQSTSSSTNAPVSLETAITKGYVALAIPSAGTGTGATGDLASAGYYILQGDHIDILISSGTNGAIRYSFQDVPVLRVGVSGAPGAAPSVYVVEVPRSQSEILTALVTAKGSQTVVKYVLRPQSEWGKVAADNSTYSPNYLPANAGPSLPATPNDNAVNAATLSSLFGG